MSFSLETDNTVRFISGSFFLFLQRSVKKVALSLRVFLFLKKGLSVLLIERAVVTGQDGTENYSLKKRKGGGTYSQ